MGENYKTGRVVEILISLVEGTPQWRIFELWSCLTLWIFIKNWSDISDLWQSHLVGWLKTTFIRTIMMAASWSIEMALHPSPIKSSLLFYFRQFSTKRNCKMSRLLLVCINMDQSTKHFPFDSNHFGLCLLLPFSSCLCRRSLSSLLGALLQLLPPLLAGLFDLREFRVWRYQGRSLGVFTGDIFKGYWWE